MYDGLQQLCLADVGLFDIMYLQRKWMSSLETLEPLLGISADTNFIWCLVTADDVDEALCHCGIIYELMAYHR